MDSPPPATSTLRRIFVSTDEPRLRAGWRVLVHGALSIGLLFTLLLPATAVITLVMLLRPELDFERAALAAGTLAAVPAITLSTWIARRWIDRRNFPSLGLHLDRQAAADLIVGFAVAGVMMALVFAAEWSMGWIAFEGWAWEDEGVGGTLLGLVVAMGVFVAVGYQEELLSRGYQLQNLIEGAGLRAGLLLSAGIFSLLHLLNPHAGVASVVGILAAGYLLAYPWLRTRQLWMSIGLHIGWNLFEGPVFGFPVSGLDIFRLIRHTVTGPEAITGGAFGPEAGLIILPAMALGAGLIWAYTQGREQAPWGSAPAGETPRPPSAAGP